MFDDIEDDLSSYVERARKAQQEHEQKHDVQLEFKELNEGCEKRGGICDCGSRPCWIDLQNAT